MLVSAIVYKYVCVFVHNRQKVFAFFTHVFMGVIMELVLHVKSNHMWNVSRNAITIKSVWGNKWNEHKPLSVNENKPLKIPLR